MSRRGIYPGGHSVWNSGGQRIDGPLEKHWKPSVVRSEQFRSTEHVVAGGSGEVLVYDWLKRHGKPKKQKEADRPQEEQMKHGLTLVRPLIEQATEFVVVTDWSPMPGRERTTGGLSYEDYDDIAAATRAFEDYRRGDYPRARAVCLFASLHGVPIGRIL